MLHNMDGGGGWIRTNVDVRQRIYSPPPLATRAPLRNQDRRLITGLLINCQQDK